MIHFKEIIFLKNIIKNKISYTNIPKKPRYKLKFIMLL